MRRYVFFIACIVLIAPLAAAAQGPIGRGETLDLGRCLAIALEQHPSILAAAGALRAGDSRIGQARAGHYPQISGSAGYNRSDPISSTTAFGSGVADSYSSTVLLSQNLYDFGRTATQVRIQELSRDSFRSDLDDVRTRVIFGVKQAYYGLLRAKSNREVSREVVGQFQQHLERAQAFFVIGTKPKFDVTKAEVDLSGARLNLLRAENALRLARVALSNAIGLPEAEQYDIAEQLAFRRLDVDLDEALRKAAERRPDLQSILIRKSAQQQSIELARKGYYPSLSGSASYGWGGSGGHFPLDQGWSFGAQLAIPLFTGYSTKYQIDEAMANLEVLAANEALLRQAIDQEVRQAWLNMQEAADRVGVAELSVRQAAENLDLANGRYASGVGSPIEVTDALAAASNAKTAHIAALSDYNVAHAALEKAVGER